MLLQIKNNALDWGAISSWLTVFVYIINAILLYKALSSQRAVQENQQRMTDWQRYMWREKIKPRFSAELSAYLKSDDPDNLVFVAQTKFKLNDHEAHNVSFPYEPLYYGLKHHGKQMKVKETGNHLRNTTIDCDFVVEGVYVPRECRNGKIVMQFCLHAMDDFQNEYEQRFLFNFELPEKASKIMNTFLRKFRPSNLC